MHKNIPSDLTGQMVFSYFSDHKNTVFPEHHVPRLMDSKNGNAHLPKILFHVPIRALVTFLSGKEKFQSSPNLLT